MHRVTIKELEKKVEYINYKLDAPEFGKGSYRLYKDHQGYQLHLIVNEGHGVRDVGYYSKRDSQSRPSDLFLLRSLRPTDLLVPDAVVHHQFRSGRHRDESRLPTIQMDVALDIPLKHSF